MGAFAAAVYHDENRRGEIRRQRRRDRHQWLDSTGGAADHDDIVAGRKRTPLIAREMLMRFSPVIRFRFDAGPLFNEALYIACFAA